MELFKQQINLLKDQLTSFGKRIVEKIEILKNCYLLQGDTTVIANDLIKEDREVQKFLHKQKNC